jgi:hypothetical protein
MVHVVKVRLGHRRSLVNVAFFERNSDRFASSPSLRQPWGELDFERPFLLPDNLLAKVISQASQAFG